MLALYCEGNTVIECAHGKLFWMWGWTFQLQFRLRRLTPCTIHSFEVSKQIRCPNDVAPIVQQFLHNTICRPTYTNEAQFPTRSHRDRGNYLTKRGRSAVKWLSASLGQVKINGTHQNGERKSYTLSCIYSNPRSTPSGYVTQTVATGKWLNCNLVRGDWKPSRKSSRGSAFSCVRYQ
jgi:hypothetical protein